MDSMDKYRDMSMVDVAFELMSKKKSAVNFFKLWEEVCQMKKFDEQQQADKESLFYTNITFLFCRLLQQTRICYKSGICCKHRIC